MQNSACQCTRSCTACARDLHVMCAAEMLAGRQGGVVLVAGGWARGGGGVRGVVVEVMIVGVGERRMGRLAPAWARRTPVATHGGRDRKGV
jgi:hypothetical protein